MTMPRVIMLDFDGVILESNKIKDNAFSHVFAVYTTSWQAIEAYHQQSPTLIRFDKFKHIAQCILKIPYTQELEKKWAEDFSTYVRQHVMNCPMVPGARELLDYFLGKVPMYVVSINPPDDLQWTIAQRGLAHYFKGVYATTRKREVLAEILAIEGVSPLEALFIGDALSDAKAASDVGINFIGRQSGAFESTQDFVIKDNLKDILSLIKN